MLTGTELSALADKYWTTRQDRLAADKVAAELKTKESKFEAQLIAEMREQKLTAVGGQRVRLTIPTTPDYVPTVETWQDLYDYIVEHKDFSLLEKRVGKAAVKERWDQGETVPGVTKFPVYKLSKSEVR